MADRVGLKKGLRNPIEKEKNVIRDCIVMLVLMDTSLHKFTSANKKRYCAQFLFSVVLDVGIFKGHAL